MFLPSPSFYVVCCILLWTLPTSFTLENKESLSRPNLKARISMKPNVLIPIHMAEAIRTRNFAAAYTLLYISVDNIEIIPQVVADVYDESEENTELILDFAESLTETTAKFIVLDSLWKNMAACSHRNAYNMMALADTLWSTPINPSDSREFRRLDKEIVDNIANVSTTILRNAVSTRTYEKSKEVAELAAALEDFRINVSDLVMRRIVIEEPSSVYLADCMYSNERLSQAIVGLNEFFWKLKAAQDLNNPAVLSIGEYLKKIRATPEYRNVSNEKKLLVNSVIQEMPPCAHNLIFAPKVCLYNVEFKGLLYASQNKADVDRRHVLTLYNSNNRIRGMDEWVVEKRRDKFYFRGASNNEYLYASSGKYNNNRRFVMTWIKGGEVGDQFAWHIKLNGKNCYISNVNFDDYLYAARINYDQRNKYVFTWAPGTENTDTSAENLKWEVRAC